MLLFNFFIPPLQLLLDFYKQSYFFLIFPNLLSESPVVVMALSIHLHELVQRFLEFSLSSFQSFILASTTFQSNFQILVHFVAWNLIVSYLWPTDKDLLLQIFIHFLQLFQTTCQFAVLLFHWLVSQLELHVLFLLNLHLLQIVTTLIHGRHQVLDLLLSLLQLLLVLLRLLPQHLALLELLLQLLHPLFSIGCRLLINILLLLEPCFHIIELPLSFFFIVFDNFAVELF